MKIIYADNNATTAVAPEVCEAMAPFFTENYFNPSSMYEPAGAWRTPWPSPRHGRRASSGSPIRKQILFTSCATESNNTAIFGAVKANPNRRHIITTAVEHPAVLEVCKDLQRNGYEVTFLGVDAPGQPRRRPVRPRPAARHAAGQHHARQQRDRRDLSHRAALAARPRRPIRRSSSTPTPRNRWASSPSTWTAGCRTSICSRSPATSCTPPRASACCTSSAARPAGRS